MKDVLYWVLAGSLGMAGLAAGASAQEVSAERAVAADAAPPSLSKQEQGAVDAAEDWLKLVARKKFSKSFHEAALVIRRSFGHDKWVTAISQAMPPLGKLQSRRLTASEVIQDMPGGDPGDYVQLRFVASYENKPEAQETVTLYRERGTWRVAGYFVK